MDNVETQATMRNHTVWNKRFVHLLSIEVVIQFATYMLNPIITGYAVSLGASLATAGFVAGVVATSALAMRPFAGFIADRLNKPILLVMSATLFMVAAFGCALSTSVVLVAVFRIVQGIALACRTAVVTALATLSVDRSHVGTAVGWIGLGTTVSCALAPSVAAFLGMFISYHACFFVAGGLYALGIVLAFRFKRGFNGSQSVAEMLHREGGEKLFSGGFRVKDFIYSPAIVYSVMAGLSGVPHSINTSLLLTVGDARGIAGIALYFTMYALAALASRPFAGALSDRRGLVFVAVPALLIELAGVTVLALMDSLVMASVAGALIGVGQGSMYSSLQAEVARTADAEALGRASNTFYIGPDVNMGLSPVVGGFVMQAWGVTVMYAVAFVFVASTFGMLYVAATHSPRNRSLC